MPIVIDVDVVELDYAIDVEVAEDEEAFSAELEPKMFIPVIPENYCKFTWDGTMLKFE